MGATYWYLAAWVLGGVALFTLLLVRDGVKLLLAPFALLGFGGGGFAARALGYDALETTLAAATAAGVVLAALGYGLTRLLRPAAATAPANSGAPPLRPERDS